MLAALLWWGGAEAQDVILLRNADEVKAEVREITDSHILYTLWGGSDKVLSLPRAEVFSVTYQNGEKELFVGDDSGATGPVTAADYPWPRVTKSYRPGDLFDEDGIRGIVISTTDNGRHGLILSLEQAPKSLRWSADSSWATDLLLGLSDREDGWNNRRRLIERLAEGKLTWEDFPAFEWCESLGPGWYLPAVDELRGLWRSGGIRKIRQQGELPFFTENQRIIRILRRRQTVRLDRLPVLVVFDRAKRQCCADR